MTSRTQNNALTHATSGSALVDLYFKLIDGVEDSEMQTLLEGAWREDKRGTAVLLFDLRNCRGGKGRYNLFAKSLNELFTNVELSDDTLRLWSGLVPHYGSFKDFWRILGLNSNGWLESSSQERFKEYVIDSYCETISKDCKDYFGLEISEYNQKVKSGNRPVPLVGHKKVSLAAKYAPKSDNAYKSFYGHVLMKLKMTEKAFRWMCADLRAHLNVVEVQMSAGKWEDIKYSSVPSVALKKYLKAFKKHSPEAFAAYMGRVKSGEAKACVQQVYPHQYVHAMRTGKDVEENSILFGEYVKQMGSVFQDTVMIIDTSGSMRSPRFADGTVPVDVSITMGLLVAWSATGPFEHKYIQFSSESKVVEIKGESWSDRVNYIYRNAIHENTNLQKATDRLIESRANVKYVLIVSDMQFDQADYGKTNFDRIKEQYKKAGLEMPTYVFWNVSAQCKDCPVTQDERGVIMISGFSPSILKMVYEVGPGVSPRSFVDQLINSEMYRPVQLP
jgi:hypothetical protein